MNYAARGAITETLGLPRTERRGPPYCSQAASATANQSTVIGRPAAANDKEILYASQEVQHLIEERGA